MLKNSKSKNLENKPKTSISFLDTEVLSKNFKSKNLENKPKTSISFLDIEVYVKNNKLFTKIQRKQTD